MSRPGLRSAIALVAGILITVGGCADLPTAPEQAAPVDATTATSGSGQSTDARAEGVLTVGG